MASFMAAVSRMAFSVLAVPIQLQFGLSLREMGLLQASLLLGYVIGQIPSGVLADRVGGVRVLTAGALLWSLAGAALAGAPAAAHPLLFMLAARAALGLAQSVLMPGVSAAAAQQFPKPERGRLISTVYAWYSMGTVAGLLLTPLLAEAVGWPGSFAVLGGAGVFCAIVAWQALPPECSGGAAASSLQRRQSATPITAMGRPVRQPCAGNAATLALLCWTHGVISFGFFVLQAWIPTFLHSLGVANIVALGLLSALPWLATTVVAVAAGRAADWLQACHGWSPLRVRRAMQSTANLGGLALMPLILAPSNLSPAAAVACLTAAVAMQGLNYPGFHAYVQDVASADAGLVLGVTNTCGTLAGIAGNLATGHLMQAAGMRAVFGMTAALYVASAATWLAFARGAPLLLTRSE